MGEWSSSLDLLQWYEEQPWLRCGPPATLDWPWGSAEENDWKHWFRTDCEVDKGPEGAFRSIHRAGYDLLCAFGSQELITAMISMGALLDTSGGAVEFLRWMARFDTLEAARIAVLIRWLVKQLCVNRRDAGEVTDSPAAKARSLEIPPGLSEWLILRYPFFFSFWTYQYPLRYYEPRLVFNRWVSFFGAPNWSRNWRLRFQLHLDESGDGVVFAIYASVAEERRGHPSMADCCLVSGKSADAKKVCSEWLVDFFRHFTPGCHDWGQFSDPEEEVVLIDTSVLIGVGPPPKPKVFEKDLRKLLRRVCLGKTVTAEDRAVWRDNEAKLDPDIIDVLKRCGLTQQTMGHLRNHHLQQIGIAPNAARRQIMHRIHLAIKARRPLKDEDLLYRSITARISPYDVVGLAFQIVRLM